MKTQTTGSPSQNSPGNKNLPVIILLFLAGALLAAGVLLGENGLVQMNAHYLCLDCMGIG